MFVFGCVASGLGRYVEVWFMLDYSVSLLYLWVFFYSCMVLGDWLPVLVGYDLVFFFGLIVVGCVECVDVLIFLVYCYNYYFVCVLGCYGTWLGEF